ncbi:MAG: glutamine--fructose-6-phosphate transaminase (isomerizing) [Bdellovibrionota bacterium]|nr:glutamine--fructose-6-phosphate transaminase (isomerizing) [Pseudobdellovibrionaceae bacterium]|tara:strand:+ start:129003 stop:130853 length:1851 start_codon:yes stop_codon:yes gene_type:complete
MCGIIGYFGDKDPKNVILDGLKKLEYRGYDSAGVCILDDGKFSRFRAEGKLSNLEEKVKDKQFNGHIGIGHTRWATHGVPSERNAHPHKVSGVSIVHNGIIENYQSIKKELLANGAKIESETDSELIAHLLSIALEDTKDLETAVEQVLPKLKGAFSIVALWEEEPNKMVAFKDGPPLVLGVGEKEILVASDITAIVSHTKDVVFLEDKEVVIVNGTDYKILDPRGNEIHKKIEHIDWNPEAAEKQGYDTYMLKEIFEQPRAVAQALEPHIDIENQVIQLQGALGPDVSAEEINKRLAQVERIFVVACGTSYYAGMVAEYMIEKMTRLPVEIEFASEFRYREPVLPPKSLVIVISQSGETADTLASLRMAKEQGAEIMSICNVRSSSIDREADYHLYMRAEAEIGVASTKALTCTLAVINVLSATLAKIKGRLARDEEVALIQKLQQIPAEMEKVLVHDKFFSEAANSLKRYKGFLYIGRGLSFPVALEGALKLKELAYLHAEGYAAGEMKHGPIALIDQDMAIVVIAPKDDVYEKTISNLEEVRARGGQVIAIGSGEDEVLKDLSLHYLSIPEGDWRTNPILALVPLQLMSYHVASSLGLDVDQPRNLAKSVTVE